MKAVILAAGEGSRFRSTVADVPKPCWRLMGAALVERAIRCAAAAGCREAVVVTGYAADRVEAFLAELTGGPGRRGRSLPIPVRWVRAPQWERGNGASLLAAAQAVDGRRFLLLMADHVMDPRLCRQAVAAGRHLTDGQVLLLVDPRLDQVYDRDEATKVRREGARITAIGKEIACYDAVDTGVFVGGPAFFDALRAVDQGNGRLTISDAAALLARQGRLVAHPVRDGWWVDVDDAPALAYAQSQLLQSAVSSGGDGPVARHLNRPISRWITALLAPTGITANTVTWMAFGLAVAGAAAFAAGQPVLGGLLVQLSSILDGSDGELARLRLQAGPAGSLLDTVLDRYADAAVIAGLMVGALGQGNPLALTVGAALAALAGVPLSALIKDRVQWLRAQRGDTARYDPLRHDPAWLSWLPANRDGRCLVIFLAGLIGKPLWALVVLAVVANLAAFVRVRHGIADLAR